MLKKKKKKLRFLVGGRAEGTIKTFENKRGGT